MDKGVRGLVETPGRKGGRGQGEGWDSEFERLCLLGELREWACEWVCRWIGTALICSSAGCANGCADGTALQLSVRAVVLCVVTRVVVPIGLSSSGGVCAGAGGQVPGASTGRQADHSLHVSVRARRGLNVRANPYVASVCELTGATLRPSFPSLAKRPWDSLTQIE